MYFIPLCILKVEVDSIPKLLAILSAVLKPIPDISSVNTYGFSFTILIDSPLNLLYIFIH